MRQWYDALPSSRSSPTPRRVGTPICRSADLPICTAPQSRKFVLERHWRKLGLTLDHEDFTDALAVAGIARITRGNFRLFIQIERVMKINELHAVTSDVVEAASSTLVIGS